MQNFIAERSWTEILRLVFWGVIIVGVVVVVATLLRGQPVVSLPNTFQAVFLDNGQAYFGKLRSVNQDFFSLTDVYYLRAGTPLQNPGPGAGGGTNQPNPAVGTIDLLKLGAELHGPTDQMIINKSHVLYYENLSENGEIVKLIRQHETQK